MLEHPRVPAVRQSESVNRNGLQKFRPIFIDPLLHTWHSAWHQEDGVNKTQYLPSRISQVHKRRQMCEHMNTVIDYAQGHRGNSGHSAWVLVWRGWRGGKRSQRGVILELILEDIGGTRGQYQEMAHQTGRSLTRFGTVKYQGIALVTAIGKAMA